METNCEQIFTKMPPGKYFLGDPCYCFKKNTTWENICDQINSKKNQGVAKIKGKKILTFNTAYGDGGYFDPNRPNVEFLVDAGLIGLTPVELIERNMERLHELGTFIESEEEIICESHENGTLRFGDWFIDTGC